MLKQEIQEEDMAITLQLSFNSNYKIHTENNIKELNETENAHHGMTKEEYEDDSDQQESYFHLPSSIAYLGFIEFVIFSH